MPTFRQMRKRTTAGRFCSTFQLFASYVRRNGTQIVFDAPVLSKKISYLKSKTTHSVIYGYNFVHISTPQ
jgi:hypothetical protein